MLNIKLDSQLLSLYNSEKREKKSFSFIFNSQLFLGNIYMRERERERERERLSKMLHAFGTKNI